LNVVLCFVCLLILSCLNFSYGQGKCEMIRSSEFLYINSLFVVKQKKKSQVWKKYIWMLFGKEHHLHITVTFYVYHCSFWRSRAHLPIKRLLLVLAKGSRSIHQILLSHSPLPRQNEANLSGIQEKMFICLLLSSSQTPYVIREM